VKNLRSGSEAAARPLCPTGAPELVQQSLLEAFGEPAVDRLEQVAGLGTASPADAGRGDAAMGGSAAHPIIRAARSDRIISLIYLYLLKDSDNL